MGGGYSVFRREELEVYEACTCLTGSEIMELYDKYTTCGGTREVDDETEAVVRGAGAAMRMEKSMEGGQKVSPPAKKAKMAQIIAQSELRNNPFRERLCQIFSSEPSGEATYGDLSFDEFVDLYHCMSPRASKEHKVQTAFRLYDFDNNGYLDRQDVYMLLKLLSTTPKKKELLENDECNDVAERVMRDCDMDGNQRISYAEFSKVVNRIPDFVTNFRLYIQ